MNSLFCRIKKAFLVLIGSDIPNDPWPIIKPDVYYQEKVLPNGEKLLIPKFRPLK